MTPFLERLVIQLKANSLIVSSNMSFLIFRDSWTTSFWNLQIIQNVVHTSASITFRRLRLPGHPSTQANISPGWKILTLGTCNYLNIATQISAATSHLQNTWSTFSTSSPHIGHKIEGMSIPLPERLNRVGRIFNRNFQIKMLTLRGTTLHPRVRTLPSGRTTSSSRIYIPLLGSIPLQYYTLDI